MTHSKDLAWLKKNKKYLNLSAIADDAGISIRVMHGTVKEQTDGHGTPFKIPDKYHEQLKKIIDSIKQK